jgi:hypothetical protein
MEIEQEKQQLYETLHSRLRSLNYAQQICLSQLGIIEKRIRDFERAKETGFAVWKNSDPFDLEN